MTNICLVLALSCLMIQGKSKCNDRPPNEKGRDISIKWPSSDLFRFPQNEAITIEKPLNVSMSLDVYPIIAGLSIRYYVSKNVGVDVSAHSILAILSYKANGFSMGLRYLLEPHRKFSPFLYGCVGPLWKTENSNRKLAGVIFSSRFGWNYISETGTNIFGSFGPAVLAVSGEKTMFTLIQVGAGLNF